VRGLLNVVAGGGLACEALSGHVGWPVMIRPVVSWVYYNGAVIRGPARHNTGAPVRAVPKQGARRLAAHSVAARRHRTERYASESLPDAVV
jgi:hypothetical protein